MFGEEWKASVVKNLDALVGSCVVVPCSYTLPKEQRNLGRTGIWFRSSQQNERIYSEDEDDVLDSFRGRTKLLGHLYQNNCTLEITDIKDHDTGSFCLSIEISSTSKNFTFADDCVEFKILGMSPAFQNFINQCQFYATMIASD